MGTKFGSLHTESLRVELAFSLSLCADYVLGQSEIILCEVSALWVDIGSKECNLQLLG